jgi:hypothetical protein
MSEIEETYKAQMTDRPDLYGDSNTRMVAFLSSAVEACESLLEHAKDALYAAQDGDWERAAQHIKSAEGYGYFDDGYHHQMIMQHIYENRKEQE